MFSKIFLGLVLTTAFVSDMHPAEAATAEISFTPEITKKIAEDMKGKSNGFKATINGFLVKKLDDPTAPGGALSEGTLSKIDEALTAGKYPDSGHYIELIEQEGLGGIYRVVSFIFNKDAADVEEKITSVEEIALVKIKKSVEAHQVGAVEPAHKDHRAHAEEEHAHQVVAAAPAPAPAPAANVESRVHSEEHRAHAEEEHAHQVVAAAPAPAPAPAANVESRVHSEEHRAHAEEHAHQVVVAEHNHDAANRSHGASHGQSPVSGLAASPETSLSQHLGKLFEDNSEEHVHQQRTHH